MTYIFMTDAILIFKDLFTIDQNILFLWIYLYLSIIPTKTLMRSYCLLGFKLAMLILKNFFEFNESGVTWIWEIKIKILIFKDLFCLINLMFLTFHCLSKINSSNWIIVSSIFFFPWIMRMKRCSTVTCDSWQRIIT